MFSQFIVLSIVLNFIFISGVVHGNDLDSLPVSHPVVSKTVEPVPETDSSDVPFESTQLDSRNNDYSPGISYQRQQVTSQAVEEMTAGEQGVIRSTSEPWNPEKVFSEPTPPPENKNQVDLDLLNHQDSYFWMLGGDDKIGMFRIGTEVNLGVGKFQFKPFYYVAYLDGPRNTDLPARLYETGVKFEWNKFLNPRLQFHTSVSPTIQSDFDNDTSDAFRLIVQARGLYIYSKETQLIFGAIYLDREDIKALPIAGVIHQFNPDFKMELIFPRPKISYRISQKSDASQWLYLGGEFGGGSWAIRRNDANRSMDITTYSDLRFILGVSFKPISGLSHFSEIGYVFDRELEYKSDIGNYKPDETFFLRCGYKF